MTSSINEINSEQFSVDLMSKHLFTTQVTAVQP